MAESGEVPVGQPEKRESEFKPSWLFQTEDELKGLGIDPKTKFGKAIRLLHATPASALDTEGLKGIASSILNMAMEEEIPEDVYGFVVGRVSDRILSIEKAGESMVGEQLENGGGESLISGRRETIDTLQELKDINRKLLDVSLNQESLQRAQIELLRRSGFSGFVSAMEARAGINVQQFDTEPPVWYDSLTQEWKNVIRTNLGILLGSYIKLKSPVKGAELLISSEDIRVDREAMADMWEKVPGFRQAMATMVFELFRVEDGRLVLTDEGKNKLSSFASYRRNLQTRILQFLEGDEGGRLIGKMIEDGGPQDLSDPELLARFAVSAAFNFLYLSGEFESGDVDRGLRDPQVFNPSVRAFFLPRKQAGSKYITGEDQLVGTDEAWGGNLGEWFAERIRHSPSFKEDFLKNEGVTRLMPERMMYGLFDLTYFENGESLSVALSKIFSENQRRELDGIFDFADMSVVNWRSLKNQELWGGYSDSMDSAWKIYQAIIGRADPKDFNRISFANSLAKLRKEKTLKDIYTGENGEWIVSAVLTSILGGPSLYSSEILLRLSDQNYDYQVWYWLNDDRVLAGLPGGARKRIFKLLNAKDLDSQIEGLASLFQDSPLGKRERIRGRIRKEQSRLR